ncbi:bifunctional phosphopantothenoylcysteine decarboxylase/phosphopantothenate synthase [Novosphingobium sp. JCM 18896]|uniref:bifunctional phosphopantothenoylcysteine decarboxylase/phosphopantothenate synthase n=1 Tax=Novosphingobium sp. JCM 18896 TaxID=2989731 RepID=UPI00222162B4|nr:bifunctional phosphopantothenoylcysteine decarboxylase/phosphopantothenate synthase [Novosphingobium sp. JCM 18896]MCW1428769.1 bifunctional phosphopantothenoylcysteine decarboxylase/phosphopantothenate synthase [Novosphingobium sp. JCM 18896]
MGTPRILLIVGGGIAAYKSCELVRLIRKGGGAVTCVLTDGGAKFVTPLALAALSENEVHTTLWDLKNEVEMGHIQLSRQADLVVVCPATANMLAKMAQGIADDLATTLLLATDKPVLAVPAMNVRMWQHAATVRNVETLRAAGVEVMEPDEGAMACGEYGPGRLPEPERIWARIAEHFGLVAPAAVPVWPDEAEDLSPEVADAGMGGLSGSMIARKTPIVFADDPFEDVTFAGPAFLTPPLDLSGPLLSKKGKARAAPPTDAEALNHLVSPDAAPPEPFDAAPEDVLAGQPDFEADPAHRPLYGKHVLITAGPTHEPIDPVRYIANRSSGKQGYAIAAAAAAMGARVTLVSGPVNLPTPPGVDRIDVETAVEMGNAVKDALPADVGVMVAAVADWRTANTAEEKIKKRGSAPPVLMLTENPDILATVSAHPKRPRLLIGFAAETENVLDNAREKRKRKGVDWIIANDVSGPSGESVMGGSSNTVHIVTEKGIEDLPEMPKEEVGRAIVERIALALGQQ